MVALKICNLWQHPDYEKELLNEIEVYHVLKFKGAGYTACGLLQQILLVGPWRMWKA